MKCRIIIAGSREFNDFDLLKKVLDNYITENSRTSFEIEIVCGGAKGADELGKKYALIKGIQYRVFLPDWKRYKHGAGARRNKEMAEYAAMEKGVLFAFWNGKSKGTKNMISYGYSLFLDVHIIRFLNSSASR